MLTRTFFHSANVYASAGRGRRAGRSIVAKRWGRLRSSLRKRWWLSRSNSSLIAWFNSAKLKKRRLRSAASIQRSTKSTPASTLALSRGFLTRAGITAMPIVRGHLLIGGIQVRFISARMENRGLAIVGDQKSGRSSKELQGSDV